MRLVYTGSRLHWVPLTVGPPYTGGTRLHWVPLTLGPTYNELKNAKQ